MRYILDQQLEPGDTLPSTADLTARFGISRPVVREALSALQACGFVDLQSGRNPTVAQLDGRLIRMFVTRAAHMHNRPKSALMEVRTPLEIQSATLAAQRASPAALAAIEEVNVRLRSALPDTEAYPTLDALFHFRIASATENNLLIWMIDSIRTELMDTIVAVRRYRDAHRLVGQEQDEHERLADAIRAGDADEAARVMRCHLQGTTDLVRKVETLNETQRRGETPVASSVDQPGNVGI